MLKRLLPQSHAPRWIVTGIDLTTALAALYVAALLRFEFAIPNHEWDVWLAFAPYFIAVRLGCVLAFRTYAGIIRHTGLADARRILLSNLCGSGLFVLGNWASAALGDGTYMIPFSIIGIEWLIASGTMVSSRWFVKWLYVYNRRIPGVQTQVAIFGAGEAGLIAKHTIDRELGESSMRVVAFIDDDRNKVGKKLEGVDVFNTAEAERLFLRGRVDRLILSIQKSQILLLK